LWPPDFIPVKKTTPDSALDFISERDAKIFTVRQPGAYLHIQKSSKPTVWGHTICLKIQRFAKEARTVALRGHGHSVV